MINCKCCHSSNHEKIYNPIKSRVGLYINVCKDCGMVFGSIDLDSDQINHNGNFSGLSCDAGYSSVRVGKAQMVQTALDIFKTEDLANKGVQQLLDMSSARGHFVRAAVKYFGEIAIDCIEPDRYMTSTYISDARFNITNMKYKNFFPEYKYDLIYSCHTLEHFRKPDENIKWIFDNLNDEGYLYLEVPNLEFIDNLFNIDEYFYDMHLSYFDILTLTNFLERSKFRIIAKKINKGSIAVLCKKSSSSYSVFQNRYEENKNLIQSYKLNIEKNRNILIENKNKVNSFLTPKNSAIFGCGRILDFLIKYCLIDISNCFLIDNFLSEATESLYGVKLNKFSDLSSDLDSINFLVLAQSSSEQIKYDILQKFPSANIKLIGEFIYHG
jgi:hypothetical protein